jgi:hypothetical protein
MYSQFYWGNLRNKDNLKDVPGVGSALRNRLRDTDWINLDQDMDTWHEHGIRTSGSIKCGNLLPI